jgi:hypothetical protein
MLNNQKVKLNKSWYNKSDILKLYPIGLSTYKNRIRKLNTQEYQKYTKYETRVLSNNRTIKERLIHSDILNELFGKIRIPSRNNVSNIIKWVRNGQWDWFGNIVPTKATIIENEAKSHFLFKKIVEKYGLKNQIIMFYSIELNKKEDFYHTHFLISFQKDNPPKSELIELIKLVCDDEIKNENRIYCEEYSWDKYFSAGASYSSKMTSYGIELLKHKDY